MHESQRRLACGDGECHIFRNPSQGEDSMERHEGPSVTGRQGADVNEGAGSPASAGGRSASLKGVRAAERSL